MACDPDPSLMQSTDFAAALRLCGQNPFVMPSGLMVLHRRIAGIPVAMLPRTAPPEDLAAQLRAIGLERCPLIISPERITPCPGLRLRKPAQHAEIDLTPSKSERRVRLHQKWRNQLRRAQDSRLKIQRREMHPDDPLPDLDATQARKQGYRNWPVPLTRAFASVASQNTQLFTAKLNGQTVAQMLFLLHGTTRATYHIGHTTALGRLHHAHNLILWEAQNWLSDRGTKRLDMGLLDAKTPGLNRFKLRAGAQTFDMGGTWLRWSPLARRSAA